MASTNQSPMYQKAQGRFLSAVTDEERIEALEEMIKECPKHKSSENMLANLKTRYKKLKEKVAKSKKSGKGSKTRIKKEDMQVAIVGKTNSGRSSLLNCLTNTTPEIASYDFTTKHPIVGMMNYATVPIQLIEIPAVGSEYFDRGTTNTADTILLLIQSLDEISEIKKYLEKAHGKQIIVLNKSDLLSENEKRKISATLQSQKYNFVLISAKTGENIEELKNKIFQSFDKIRVYTKEPGKEKTKRPIILPPESTLKNIAEKILKGFSAKVKETRIWGPSSKFPGQKVGLNHKLKDLDVVEFKTK
ncbi:MAG: GTPase [Nanoarchaeota archaeon]